MNKDSYCVEKQWFKAYLDGLNQQTVDQIIENSEKDHKILYISQATGTILAEAWADAEYENIKYYIYANPSKEDSIPLKAKRKIVLTTPQEVQLFMDIYNKFMGQNKND